MSRGAVRGLLVLVTGLLIAQGIAIFGLSNKVRGLEVAIRDLEEPCSSQFPPLETPTPSFQQAVDEVDQWLAELANRYRILRRRTGAFPRDLGPTPSEANVVIVSSVVEPSGFCFEAEHTLVEGVRRRFLSLTGDFDYGNCRRDIPLSEQTALFPIPTPGSHYVISDVHLVTKDISKREPTLRTKYQIVFDARWVGTTLPPTQICDYTLLDSRNNPIYRGTWGFSHVERFLDDFRGPALFESRFPGRQPRDVEMECESEK